MSRKRLITLMAKLVQHKELFIRIRQDNLESNKYKQGFVFGVCLAFGIKQNVNYGIIINNYITILFVKILHYQKDP